MKNSINDSLNEMEKDYDYYLVNKNYINELFSIFHWKEIFNILSQHRELVDIKLRNDFNNIEALNKLLFYLKEEEIYSIINDLKSINEENIKMKLNNKNLYKLYKKYINNDSSTKLYYFENTIILNKELINLLTEIDKDIKSKKKTINCIFDKRKIIIFIDYEIINVGHLNENGILIIDYLIKSNNYFYDCANFYDLFNSIKLNGYQFIENYLPSNFTKYCINIDSFEEKKTNFEKVVDMNLDNCKISEKLKTLLLLSIIQYKNNKNHFCNI